MSERIVLKDWTEGANKVRAVNVVCECGGLGLKSGKRVVDQCLAGDEPSFEVSGETGARKAAEQLTSLGFVVQID